MGNITSGLWDYDFLDVDIFLDEKYLKSAMKWAF